MSSKVDILNQFKGGIIVSCQALEGEPLHGSEIMARMALAAQMGGAKGIRANSVADILAIKKRVSLPVIGIIKKEYPDCDCYITPTMKEVDELVSKGKPDIIAVDATKRSHPDGLTGGQFIKAIKEKYPKVILMADVSIFEEGLAAALAGADLVSTTLAGYTAYSPKINGPDFSIIKKLANRLFIPVIGEGRYWKPEQIKKALSLGAFAVVVGSVITRPKEITESFVTQLSKKTKIMEDKKNEKSRFIT